MSFSTVGGAGGARSQPSAGASQIRRKPGTNARRRSYRRRQTNSQDSSIPPDVSWISARRRRFRSPTPAVYSVSAPSSTASKRPSRICTSGTSSGSPCIRLLSGRRSTRPDSRANHWAPRRSADYKRQSKSQAPRDGRIEMTSRSWIPYAALLVVFWGVWGAFSSLPTDEYGYPDEMIYILWSVTMLIPAYSILRSERTFDRRPIAAIYGLLIGLTGAGGQLVLFKALTIGPAYLIFPIIALSPGITVLMATFLLRERLLGLTKVGIVLALIALVFFNISGGSGDADVGPWLILALLITLAWGVQAYYMRKAASVGVNDGTTFGYMALSGLLLVPVAFIMMGGFPGGAPWQAPTLTFVTQLLNAVGALFLVMALSRGKASIVAPTTNALAPVLTVLISLAVYQTLPSVYGAAGIVLAIVGSTLMVYGDEKRGEVDAEEQTAIANETSDASPDRSEANKPTV